MEINGKKVKQTREDRGGVLRGDIYYILPDKKKPVGSEQQSGRPALVVSNNTNNHFSEVIEVVYLTKQDKKTLPTHVKIRVSSLDATVLCEQIYSVSVERFGNFMGHIQGMEMSKVNEALKISLGI